MADVKCTSSTQVSVPQQKYSDDGEPILAEGICCRGGVFADVCIILFALFFILTVPICFPFLCFIPIYCGRRAALSWRLYLTPSGIHHTKAGLTSPCCYKKIFIPLTDIISVTGNDAGNEITIAYRDYKILVVTYVDNASMFTEAVKQQVSART